jgi:methyltransferase
MGGPYRYLRHPNYVAIVGELVSVARVTGAIVAGPLATAAFGALKQKRIAVEERALRLR